VVGYVTLIPANAWSKTLQTTDRTTIPANQVMALFANRAHSFSLASGATFADLAARLDQLGERQSDLPQAIYLKFGATRQPVSVAQSVI
jgi:hypothetical protein